MEYVKLFHLLFTFVWIGNLFALTRLLGYQSRLSKEAMGELLPLLRRSYLFVGLPSLTLSILLGVALLVFLPTLKIGGWLHLKLTAVFLLVLVDLALGRAIERGTLKGVLPSARFFKLLHAFVGVLLITIFFSIYVLKGAVKEETLKPKSQIKLR